MTWRQTTRHLYQQAKRSLEWPLFFVFDSLALALTKTPRSKNRKIAIVHIELLGDFFIWLPYGQAMARKIVSDSDGDAVIVVEAQLAELARACFPGYRVLPVSRREFMRSPVTRWQTLRALRKLGVNRCFHPSAPRDALLQDAIVRALGAPTLGFDSVFADRPWADRAVSQRYYERLLPDCPDVHQQVRYRRFLDIMDAPSAHPVTLPAYPHPMNENPYLVVAPGGSRTFRQWPAERFAELARRLLHSHPDWRCVVIGGNNEHALTEKVRELIGGSTMNLCGQTGIKELCAWIAHAKLVIGNDSAPGHIAAAYGSPSLVITGGGHWQRCYPYDEAEAPIRTHPLAISSPMPCFGCNWCCEFSLQDSKPFPCISAVSVEAAWQLAQQQFPLQP